jgi:hypothetical protein
VVGALDPQPLDELVGRAAGPMPHVTLERAPIDAVAADDHP